MQNTVISYNVNSPYDGPEENLPLADSVGLLFEGVPIYKLWLSSPLETELSLLRDKCTYVGLSTPSPSLNIVPFFVFGNTRNAQLRVQAPMCSLRSEVERWASGDSNVFVFLLIERSSGIVKSISCVGVPKEFRRTLATLWSSGQHLLDLELDRRPGMLTSLLDRSLIVSARAIWTYNSDTEEFEQTTPAVPSRTNQAPFTMTFTLKDTNLGVSANDSGTITALDSQGNATMILDRGNREIKFNLNDHPHIDYGYVVSSLGAKLKSVESLILDEDNTKPSRRALVNDVLEVVGYVPIARATRSAVACAFQ